MKQMPKPLPCVALSLSLGPVEINCAAKHSRPILTAQILVGVMPALKNCVVSSNYNRGNGFNDLKYV
jgi:hypothetical protein